MTWVALVGALVVGVFIGVMLVLLYGPDEHSK